MPKLTLDTIPNPVSQPRASASDFGAGIGAAQSDLGAAVSSLGLIGDAWLEQEGTRRATDFSSEYQEEADKIALTGDLEKAPEQLNALQRKLKSKHRGGSAGVFDRQSKRYGDQITNRSNHRIRLRQIDSGRSTLDAAINFHLTMADRPDITEEDLGIADAQVESLIQSGVANGFINEGEAATQRQNYMLRGAEKYRKRVSQSTTDDIMSRVDKETGASLSNAEQLQLARTIEDPDLRDDVVARVKNRITENERFETKRMNQETDSLWGETLALVNQNQFQQAMDVVDSGLGTPKERKEAKKYIEEKRDGKLEEVNEDFQSVVWRRYSDMRIDEPKRFAEADIWNDYATGKISKEMHGDLKKAQDELRVDGVDQGLSYSDSIRTYVDTQLKTMRPPGELLPAVKANLEIRNARVHVAMYKQVLAAEYAEGRPLGFTEKLQLFQSVLNENIEVDTWGPGGTITNIIDLDQGQISTFVKEASDKDSPIYDEILQSLRLREEELDNDYSRGAISGEAYEKLKEDVTPRIKNIEREAIEYFDLYGGDVIQARINYRDKWSR
jgi:hypothetical protein